MNKLVNTWLVVIAIMSISSCSYLKTLVGIGPKKPKFSIEEVDYVSLSSKYLKLMLSLKVFNPNDFNLELSNARYSVVVDDSEFANGVHKKKIIAVENAYSLVRIPIKINLQNTGSILKRSLITGEKPRAKWFVQAEFHGPLGKINVTFEDQKPLY